MSEKCTSLAFKVAIHCAINPDARLSVPEIAERFRINPALIRNVASQLAPYVEMDVLSRKRGSRGHWNVYFAGPRLHRIIEEGRG